MIEFSAFSLKGLNTLITGASGGIGSAIAREFYRHGANVILSGTKVANLEKLKEEFSQMQTFSAERPKISLFPCDLADLSNVEVMIKGILEEHKSLDVLVNNAGITRDNLLIRMKDEEWQKVLDINLSSCFRACRAAVKSMMLKRFGRIINISSISGVIGNPGQTNYCATKAGIIGFSKALAREVATRNITVNCISPGFIESQMTDGLAHQVKEGFLNAIPMQRMGKPEEIAHAAVFLASPAASYITGQNLNVNGGFAMV
jgi:3-oxoacyl-[acyl-carrier protein] reductase